MKEIARKWLFTTQRSVVDLGGSKFVSLSPHAHLKKGEKMILIELDGVHVIFPLKIYTETLRDKINRFFEEGWTEVI